MTQIQEKKLPEWWIETTLGEIVETNILCINKHYKFDEIVYLDTGSITEWKKEALQNFNISEAPSRAKRLVKENDIIYSTVRPNQKHFGFIQNPQENLIVSTGFTVISTIKWKAEPKFLYYFITQEQITNILQQIAEHSTSTYPSIKPEHIKKLVILLPSLPEQKSIAKILSSFDDKIELLREQNETLEKIGQEIFKEWFGKYKVWDDLPDGWRVGKLGEVIENYDWKRIPISSDKREKWIYPYYWATWVNGYVKDYIFDWVFTLLWEDGSVIKEDWKPFTQYVWWKIWVNNHAHVLQWKNGFSTEMIKIILDNTEISPYVNWAVQLKINQTNMNSIPVIISDGETLWKFNNLIQPIFTKIRCNFEQMQILYKTRDKLLPRLMKAEVRVV